MAVPPAKKTTFWLFCGLFFSYIFYAIMSGNQADLDLWGRMAMGALIHQNGAFPGHDPFSYTAPNFVWIDHEWGSGVVFYWTFLLFSSAGLFWLKVLLLALALGVVTLIHLEPNHREPGWGFEGRRMTVFLVALGATVVPVLTGYMMTIRCQTFSFLFYVWFLWVLERYRWETGRRLLWSLPPTMILWANLHGGFAYGFVVLGLYSVWMAFEKRRREAGVLAGVIVLCLCATLVNPYGIPFLTKIVKSWGMERPAIAEWQSVFRHYIPAYGAFYAAYLLFWIAAGFLDWRKDWRRFPGVWLLMLATAWQGYQHYKLMPFFALTVAALGPRLEFPIPRRLLFKVDWNSGRIRWGFVAVPAILMVCIWTLCAVDQARVDDRFRVFVASPSTRRPLPVDAARFIQVNNIRGNLWCDFSSGEFLFWTLYPQMRISIDGRYEAVYPKGVMDDFVAFFRPPTDVSVALNYPTTHVLIPAERSDLAEQLENTGRWTLIFADDISRLYALDFPKVHVEKSRSTRAVFLDYFKGDLTRFRLNQ